MNPLFFTLFMFYWNKSSIFYYILTSFFFIVCYRGTFIFCLTFGFALAYCSLWVFETRQTSKQANAKEFSYAIEWMNECIALSLYIQCQHSLEVRTHTQTCRPIHTHTHAYTEGAEHSNTFVLSFMYDCLHCIRISISHHHRPSSTTCSLFV